MKSLLLVDDDKDLCFVMRELFIGCGAKECLCLNSVDELQGQKQALKFDIILLDVNLGDNSLNGLDAYNWLVDHNFQGKIVFFTGHGKSHPLVKKALDIPNVMLLEKPASVESIEALIQ